MSSSQQPPSPVTFLLDRTHQSKLTAQLLRDLGVNVEVHKRWYLPEDPDPNWITDSSKRGWAIISGDKGIELDGLNRFAVVQAKAKVFVLSDTNSRGAEWAASLITARNRMTRIVAENNGPFYCRVEKGRDDHVGKVKFLEGGGPIPRGTVLEPQISTPPAPEAQKPVEPKEASTKQTELFDNPDKK